MVFDVMSPPPLVFAFYVNIDNLKLSYVAVSDFIWILMGKLRNN